MSRKPAFLCLALLFVAHAYAHEHSVKSEFHGDFQDFFKSDAGVSDGNKDEDTSSDATATATADIPLDDGGNGLTSHKDNYLLDPVEEKTPSKDVETKFKGKWEIHSANSGVSAMHLMILPNNKAIMFDATTLGKSELPFPAGHCAMLDGHLDCFAHGAEYDINTAEVRPLKVETDTWCSSGGLTVDGVLVQAGGNKGGGKTVRRLELCETCDWKEYVNTLAVERWYSTQQVLPDGRFIVVGGRGTFNYEFVPGPGDHNPTPYRLPFLQETTDPIDQSENNLYPHVHLSTDGNLFIFANTKSILYDPNNHKVLRNYPELPGGPRNYPGTAPSAILPIKVPPPSRGQDNNIPVVVAICGGGQKYAFESARLKKQFLPALKSCARIKITDPNPTWKVEDMPGPRVMGDMLILPTGDLIIINGAKSGSGGWEFAEDPYYSPVVYSPNKPKETRFQELQPSTIARMYHSTAAILPDGKVLVAGSSTHQGYQYINVKYPTELRVEKFSPPYLDPALAKYTPIIETNFDDHPMYTHGEQIELEISVNGEEEVQDQDLKVHIYSPPFTTHSYAMNQRMLILPKQKFSKDGGSYKLTVTLPPNGAVAPPGYYMLFVVNRGIPSKAAWMRLNLH